MRRRFQLVCGSLAVAVLLIAQPGASAATARTGGHHPKPRAIIRYTEHGVPHIVADSFVDLGYGYGYAIAKDNICTLAKSYLTLRAERSRYFGPDGPSDITISLASNNLNSDLFFQQINDSGIVEQLAARPAPQGPQPEVRQIVTGYVQGYNRYLADRGPSGITDPTCRDAEWLTPISELDVYRALYAGVLYGGMAGMADGIVNAQPATAAQPIAATAETAASFAAGLAEEREAIAPGSNAFAIGSQGAAHDRSILLANPHFYWHGFNRFWQVQLTVPGKLNATGASLLASPFLMIGYNKSVAWSHTWASPVTYGLYEIQLAPDDPTAYLVDGQKEQMTRRTVRVKVKQPDGTLAEVSRTLYSTRYGPMVTRTARMDLPWTTTSAYTVRDANATNLRALNSSLAIATASSTSGIVDALTRTQGVPIFNTIAADRYGNALIADIQVVPHVTDELALRCGTPLGQYVFPLAGLPILNGSDSTCAWGSDPKAVDPGIFAPYRMLRLSRRDYVTNANQSPWLSNLRAPLTGYPRILGDIATERSPRTREAIISMEEGIQAGGFTRQSAQDMLFKHRSRVAVLAAADTAAMCAAFPDGLAPSSTGPVDVSTACDALATWDHTYSLDSRGSLLFERFVMQLASSTPVPTSLPWKVPFDPQDPVNTPHTLATDRADVQTAFGDAAAELHAANIPLDARLRDYQAVFRGTERIPLPGAAWQMGILNVVHPVWDPRYGNVEVGIGSTYLQVVAFDGDLCPNVATLLTTSQSSDPTSPYYADQTKMFSAGQWAKGRYCETEILTSPELRIVPVY